MLFSQVGLKNTPGESESKNYKGKPLTMAISKHERVKGCVLKKPVR